MAQYKPFLLILLLGLLFTIGFASPVELERRVAAPSGVVNAKVVAKDGSGHYKTIQAAVNSISSSNSKEMIIYIKAGTYKEQVTIKQDYVTLVGDGTDNTIITYNLGKDDVGDSHSCSTVRLEGDNFAAFDITFENTFGTTNPAPALYTKGKKYYFSNCFFLGSQDTLLIWSGTEQYFQNCKISGSTDFIWGAGRAVFNKCQLLVNNKKYKKTGTTSAYITAQGNKDSSFKTGGFLISECKVKVESGPKPLLGRLWKKYAYVIFSKCDLPSTMNSKGWTTFSGHESYSKTAKVGTYKNTGSGASKVKDGQESYAKEFSSVPSISSFLDGGSILKRTIYGKTKDGKQFTP